MVGRELGKRLHNSKAEKKKTKKLAYTMIGWLTFFSIDFFHTFFPWRKKCIKKGVICFLFTMQLFTTLLINMI
jgi:hypothetical protein